jgi:hypothetical protein
MDCKEDPQYVIDCEEGSKCLVTDSKCRIQGKPDVIVTLTVERMLIDCKLDVLPANLPTRERHRVIVRSCAFVHEEEKDGVKVVTEFAVKVEDVDLPSIRLHPCLIWPDCVEDLAEFNAFQGNGLRQKEAQLLSVACDKEFAGFFGTQCQVLVLSYDEQALLKRGCGTCVRTLGVIGQLKTDAKAISRKGGTLEVGEAFIRGLDVVACSTR